MMGAAKIVFYDDEHDRWVPPAKLGGPGRWVTSLKEEYPRLQPAKCGTRRAPLTTASYSASGHPIVLLQIKQ
jgi:hypothetical protein